ncbi:MAG: phosphatase PAP2 family protein [Candidatus Eremiobacteraeota bacterium]|nr:phosphatase PAP2 family protein [Candidatus Eremiobacteraeota bacterium]
MDSDAPLSQLEMGLDRFGRHLLLFYLVFTVVLGLLLKHQGFIADFSGYFELSGVSPMNAAGLAALYVAFLACRPGKGLIQLSVLLSLVAEVFYQLLVLPESSEPWERLMTLGGGTGLVGLSLTLYLWGFATGDNARARARAFLLAGLCLLFYPLVAGKGIGLLSHWTPEVLDSHVYALEGALGFFPVQFVAKFLYAHPWLNFLALAVYARLPLLVFIGIYANARYPECCYFDVLKAFIGAGLLAFGFYLVLPMVGISVYAGASLLGELPPPKGFQAVVAPASFPRTCIPSLHTTWVLLFYLAVVRVSRAAGVLASGALLLTLTATMAPTVGHYSVDLLVAVPYTLGIIGLATPSGDRNGDIRRACLSFGFGCTLFWLILLRWLPQLPSALPLAGWILLIASCLVSARLQRRLSQEST